MVDTELFDVSPVTRDGRAMRIARKVGRAMLEFVDDYARAMDAAALADAHHRDPKSMRALYVNDPAEPPAAANDRKA